MKKNMTKEMVENLTYILLGGGSRADFERIHNFNKEKLDSWFKRFFSRMR